MLKNILLTGGSGFIGKNILESFLNEEYNILSPSSKELDLSKEDDVDAYFDKNEIDIVIHAAVKPSHRNAKDFTDIFYTNTRMFFNLERHKDKYEKMLVIGSGAIYDCRNYRPKMREDEYIRFIPADNHGFCKYVCEKVIEHSENIYDLRVFGIFGKYEDYVIRFISNAICKTIYNLPITIKQNRRFDYLFVNDLIPILKWFIEHNPLFKSYNITPDEAISLLDIAHIIKEISGSKHPIILDQHEIGLEYSGNNKRLKAEFDNIKFTHIKESIKFLYEWYKENIDSIDKNQLLFDK